MKIVFEKNILWDFDNSTIKSLKFILDGKELVTAELAQNSKVLEIVPETRSEQITPNDILLELPRWLREGIISEDDIEISESDKRVVLVFSKKGTEPNTGSSVMTRVPPVGVNNAPN